MPRGPLTVIRTGTHQEKGYIVDNIAIETLPGYYLTAISTGLPIHTR